MKPEIYVTGTSLGSRQISPLFTAGRKRIGRPVAYQDREDRTPHWGSHQHPKRRIGTPDDITRQSLAFPESFPKASRQSKEFPSFTTCPPELEVTRQRIDNVFFHDCLTPERLLATQVAPLDGKKMKTHGLDLKGREKLAATRQRGGLMTGGAGSMRRAAE